LRATSKELMTLDLSWESEKMNLRALSEWTAEMTSSS
jgi:hypothetical protein